MTRGAAIVLTSLNPRFPPGFKVFGSLQSPYTHRIDPVYGYLKMAANTYARFFLLRCRALHLLWHLTSKRQTIARCNLSRFLCNSPILRCSYSKCRSNHSIALGIGTRNRRFQTIRRRYRSTSPQRSRSGRGKNLSLS